MGIMVTTWGAGGAVFGGIARGFGYMRHRTPESDVGSACAVGAKRGAIFCAVFGYLFGGLVGFFEKPDLVLLLVSVLASCLILGIVAILAVVFGTLGHALEWLGTSSRHDSA
jgi:hypothetical protein